jgi:hypothetical protein
MIDHVSATLFSCAIKLVCALMLLASSVWGAEPIRIETTLVDAEAISGGTYQSHNQKVVQNRRGIFMTHLRSRNEPYTAQQWRLSWSRDGGRTFTTLFEATDATNPPVLETDSADNVYLGRPDFVDRNAYLYRFLAGEDYREPHITPIPDGSGGKYAMLLDAPRSQVYWISHNRTFSRLDLDGGVLSSGKLFTADSRHAVVGYPHLSLDAEGVLHAAWTTVMVPAPRPVKPIYWDIHYMRSPDGGQTWSTMAGQPLSIPVPADNSGATDRITLDDEYGVSNWLANMHLRDGKAHFLYLARTTPPRQHHTRFDMATAKREVDHREVSLKGETLGLSGLDGFFASDPRRTGGPLYCISRDVLGGRIACLISRDQGGTWHDYAESVKLVDADSAEFHQPYAVGGCRDITEDGFIIGSFTELAGTERTPTRGGKVWFFKIKAE